MLDEKATEATNQILGLLQYPNVTFHFVIIQPIILKELELAYLQGRKDQIDKVVFKQGPGGELTFPGK